MFYEPWYFFDSRKNENITRKENPIYAIAKDSVFDLPLENVAEYGNMANEILKVISPKPGYDVHMYSRYQVDQCKNGFVKVGTGCQKLVGCEEIKKAEATASVKIGNGRVKDHT